MSATITVSGTIDEIVELAAILKIGREVQKASGFSTPGATGSSTALTRDESEMVRVGNYIGCIKEVRTRLGLGLKEARDLVDASPERKAYTLKNP